MYLTKRKRGGKKEEENVKIKQTDTHRDRRTDCQISHLDFSPIKLVQNSQ
jgi:hypothetical protein